MRQAAEWQVAHSGHRRQCNGGRLTNQRFQHLLRTGRPLNCS
jgi:hypothetical protein